MKQQNRLKSNNDLTTYHWNNIIGIICLILSLGSLIYYSKGSWDYFIHKCPNRDVLSWDENIRLITVYDQYSELAQGNIWSGLKPFLESPTWPPLRSLITFLLLFFPQNLLVTEWDSLVGLLFLIAAYISLVFIFYLLTHNILYTGIGALSSFALIFHTIELSAYGLSSMLETQSMLILVWCYYFFFCFFQEGDTLKTSTKLGFSIFLLLFFFTKYPYGLMLFMALFLIEFIRHKEKIPNIFRFAIQKHYRGIRVILFLIVFLVIVSIPIIRLFEGIDLNQRAFKRSLYFLSLPVFLDFQYFIWKNRKELTNIVPNSLRILYLYSFLPAMVWIYTNPDRISSLLDAQMIVSKYTKSFFLSIVASRSSDPMLPMALFDDPWGIRILLFAGLISFGIVWKHKSEDSQNSFWQLGLMSAILFLQILILETTTGNKQLRHLLQYLPVLVLLPWLWVFQALDILRKNKILHLVFQVIIGVVFLGTIFVLSGSRGLWAGNFFQDRYFCLRGEDSEVFKPVRWADEVLPKDLNFVIWNSFHDKENFHKKGRLIATEFDLKIRQSRFRNSIIRNDNKHKIKSWDAFHEVVFISDNCKDTNSLEKLKKRASQLHVVLHPVVSYEYPNGDFCIQRFTIYKETSTNK